MGTKRVPEANNSVEQAGEELIRRIKEQAATGPAPVQLVWNDHEAEVIKGNQYRAAVWLHSPAMVRLMANAYRRLLKVAADTKVDLSGNPVELTGNKITKVRAARAKGKKVIYIVPTPDSDTLGIPVNMDGSSAYVNLITILSPAKMTVAAGYRERYEAEFAEEGKDPIFPALRISLVKPLERRKARKEKDEEESEATAKTKAKTKTANTTDATATEATAADAKAVAPKALDKTETPK